MPEYLHLNPNFGKHKLIPILLAIPVLVFALIFLSSKQQIDEVQKVSSATVAPTPEVKEVQINGVSIPVEIADTDIKRQQGLSNRPPLDEGHGMLFVFPSQNQYGAFWMKEMYFDIDIIWINDGKILQVHENVPAHEYGSPEQYTTYRPDGAYDYVLEMNAGSAQKYGFAAGAPVIISGL